MVEKKYNKKDYLQFSQVILEECMYIKQYKFMTILEFMNLGCKYHQN